MGLKTKILLVTAVGAIILAGTFFRFPLDRFSAKAESLRIHAACEASLADFAEFRTCLSQELVALMPNGLAAVFETFNDLLDLDPRFKRGCHLIIYPIGAETYARYASSSASDFLVPDASACNYGFYHGFIVSLMADSKNPAQAGAFCESFDEEILTKRPDAKNQCYHGLGHGLFNLFLPEEVSSVDRYLQANKEAIRGAIIPAIDACEKIADMNTDGRDNCVSGVFHDIAMPHDGMKRNIDPRDPLWFCKGFETEVSGRCFGNVMQVVIDLFPHNSSLQSVLSYVQTTYNSSPEIMTGIVRRWGFSGDKSDAAIRECQTLEPSLRASCLEGIRTGIEQSAGSRNVYLVTDEFCARKTLSSEDRSQCIKHSFEYFKLVYSREEVRQICKKLSPQYEAACAK